MANKVKAMARVSNKELWDLARRSNPTFASHTAQATSDLFTERGFEALKRADINAINEYFEISLRVAFQGLWVSRAKNPLEGKGIIKVFDTPNGGYIQRMGMKSIKPVSPAFKGLQNGDSVDPFIVRKPEVEERFFQQNFDYQSFITMQNFNIKQIFISDYGVGEFVSGIMQGLQNGYTTQEYVNILEAINKAINSTLYPLRNSQQLVTPIADITAPTNEELTNFILGVKDLVSIMDVSPQTNAFNAAGFNTTYSKDEFVLLLRAGIKNRISVNLMTGAFNPENLSIPVDIQEVANFGGLIPYQDAEFTTRLYPAYDARTGEQIGWNTEENQTTATVEEGEEFYQDTNANVLGVLMQKGLIFENRQNPYEVSPIYNPRGLYTNYWASSPNNAIVVDPYYAMVVIKSA